VHFGTRPGILRVSAGTGGVITSAGVVLAATIPVLGVLALVFLAELGFAVAFGVLLDTFIVRAVLVPALAYDRARSGGRPSCPRPASSSRGSGGHRAPDLQPTP
jgi:RND superfamily putative drug exporter